MHTTIVSAEELHAHIGDPRWVVVDCRHSLLDFSAGRKQYEIAHIPGAFFGDVEQNLAGAHTGKNGRHPLPEWSIFEGWLRALGVNDDTQVVAYDAGADMFASRLWFMLRVTGHDAVAVLDGGFAAWTQAGYAADAAVPSKPNDGNITLQPRSDMMLDADGVLRALEARTITLLDARGADRFQGQNETMDPVAGHIPGAVNRPFRSNFNEDGRFKSPGELREEFEATGLKPGEIVHQCGSGVSAAVNMLAMEIAGLPKTKLYPGSWSEWCSERTRPMVTY